MSYRAVGFDFSRAHVPIEQYDKTSLRKPPSSVRIVFEWPFAIFQVYIVWVVHAAYFGRNAGCLTRTQIRPVIISQRFTTPSMKGRIVFFLSRTCFLRDSWRFWNNGRKKRKLKRVGRSWTFSVPFNNRRRVKIRPCQ